jgi:hypothetical protein
MSEVGSVHVCVVKFRYLHMGNCCEGGLRLENLMKVFKRNGKKRMEPN